MKTRFLFIVAVVVFFGACEKSDDLVRFELGGEEKFRVQQDYFSEDEVLNFTITEINDSRCPSDVVCVWQGEALVNIEIKSPQPGTITLSTHDNLIDTLGSYSYELKNVSPYPVSTEAISLEDYVVRLKIVKL